MKLRFSCSMIGVAVVFASAWIPAWNAASAATLSVTPAAISNTYSGKIVLQIGGLTNGESVRIRKYADGNANGVLDGADVLLQQFRLNDGVAAVIGGGTNINVPFDTTPTNGTIVTPISFQGGGVGQAMAGQYIYLLFSPTGNFVPVTNLFNVTNSNYAQSFTGSVVCGGSNVPYASVMLFTPPVGDGGMEFIAGTVANSSGGYTIPVPAGTYFLMTTRDGYAADLSTAPTVTLSNAVSTNVNLNLAGATRTVSGRMVDLANTNQGIPALMILCESTNHQYLAIGFSSTNGDFTVPVPASRWRVGNDDQEATFYGYLRLKNDSDVWDTTSGNVSNVLIALPHFTALIYGTVKDGQNNPMAGIRINGSQQNNGNGPYEADAITDENGYYALGIVGGTNWYANINGYPGYIFTQMNGNADITNTQALLQNFIGIPATNHITGMVRDSGGNPITQLNVYANANIGTNTFNSSAETDTNGAYSLTVANGSWYVGVDCNRLTQLGLKCPGNKSTNILNADGVVNFIISDLAITTASLPAGTNGVFYSQALAASGGQMPYLWSLGPGLTNLPAGLTLATNGVLSGTLTGFDWVGFSVRVTDNQGATAETNYSLFINPPPLRIATTNLPAGTNGQYYDQVLEATGGVPPYNWYLPNGSMALPPGLNLNANGALYGTPTTNGVFNFYVSVYVTNYFQATTQQLSLTIAVAPLQPLQITTTSPLPSATRSSFYYTTLAATGGQLPYRWSLAPGSASLPPGLTLTTNGVLSGTPTVTSNYWFYVRVTDSVPATNDLLMNLSVNEPVVTGPPLTGLTQPGPGQFQFSFNTSWGVNYTVQYSSDLIHWYSILTIGGSGSPLTVIDPNAAAGQRFYRVRIGP